MHFVEPRRGGHIAPLGPCPYPHYFGAVESVIWPLLPPFPKGLRHQRRVGLRALPWFSAKNSLNPERVPFASGWR